MIVLQSTSQVKYVIDGKEYVCYTNRENRVIAKIFLEGERDSAMLVNCNTRIETIETISIVRKDEIEQYKLQVKTLSEFFDKSIAIGNSYKDERDKARKANKIFKSLSGILLILLILK